MATTFTRLLGNSIRHRLNVNLYFRERSAISNIAARNSSCIWHNLNRRQFSISYPKHSSVIKNSNKINCTTPVAILVQNMSSAANKTNQEAEALEKSKNDTTAAINNNTSSEPNESISSSSSPTPTTENLSTKDKLKQAVRDYGATVIVFHVAMSLTSLGICYLLVSSGLDVIAILGKLGLSESILQNSIAAGASTFVVAYAFHKVFAPVRITITLTATPLIVRKLRSMGILKQVIKSKTN